MHMKTKEPGWKENHGIQDICTEDSQKNITVDQRQEQKIWDNYSTGLYNRASRQENSEVENEQEADADEISPYIFKQASGKSYQGDGR